MNDPQSPQRIVVGIDGSDAAINAAKWAVAEAISRDVPLRLVHAIPERQPDGPAGDESLDIEYGETALRQGDGRLSPTPSRGRTKDPLRARALTLRANLNGRQSPGLLPIGPQQN
jgi:nucleotide-binding universal stress UspA family protein